ncbi:MAG: hypothetical protein KDK07_07965 [Bauldia sp.]|nr:hypothetical protein [Bauldia sp.]
MALRTRVEPLDRDIAILVDETLSPAAQSRAVATFARAQLAAAQDVNRRVLGRIPPHQTFVDGVARGDVDAVKPQGRIVYEFELVDDVLVFIGYELRAVSPVRSGRYRDSHSLFADGVEVPIGGAIPVAREYVFLSAVAYARKIEGSPSRRPLSRQAPKGVYAITAAKASARFGNLARIRFAFQTPVGGALAGGVAGNKSAGRVPAIVVTLR